MKEEAAGDQPMWLFKYKTDQSAKTGLNMSTTGMYNNLLKSQYWTGSLLNEVLEVQAERKIGLIECADLKTARQIHQSGHIECNFVYIMPPDTDSIQNRLIRNRYGTESKQSLAAKIAQMRREMDLIKG